MKSTDIRIEDRNRESTITSYIEGPKTALPSGWLQKAIIQFNAVSGWDSLKITEVNETTSWFRRTIFFSLSGPAFPLQVFVDEIETAVNNRNASGLL